MPSTRAGASAGRGKRSSKGSRMNWLMGVAISRKKKARQAKTSQRPKRRPRQIRARPIAPTSSAKWPGRAGNHSIFEIMNAKSVMTGPRRRGHCQSSAAPACQAKGGPGAMRPGTVCAITCGYLRPLPLHSPAVQPPGWYCAIPA